MCPDVRGCALAAPAFVSHGDGTASGEAAVPSHAVLISFRAVPEPRSGAGAAPPRCHRRPLLRQSHSLYAAHRPDTRTQLPDATDESHDTYPVPISRSFNMQRSVCVLVKT
ncbi:hypothetical protein AAFF_G00408660 [Aldrovandia affinis]|uniref:Uncharacterized protein n=1 Tax=Aldrovandia affinis TaxID=143900 RepID=A0AAD7WJX4_9TELE|nr:hypothetical protein AAFF_G00408660 [Aldrovandia affinis]